MEVLLSEERILNTDRFKAQFFFTQSTEFILSPSQSQKDIIAMVGQTEWQNILFNIRNLNTHLKSFKSLEINKECLLVPPHKHIWALIYLSIFLILISFILEILSAYFVFQESLAYAGIGIIFIPFTLMSYLIVSQLFFGEINVEKYMFQPEYSNKVTEVVSSYISNKALIDIGVFAKFEYKAPFLLEIFIS